jgi:hypothetical protein
MRGHGPVLHATQSLSFGKWGYQRWVTGDSLGYWWGRYVLLEGHIRKGEKPNWRVSVQPRAMHKGVSASYAVHG